ncbi:unnamed protein product [Cuscuta epithymum]|uniref:C3H1-type domain-containing protein n=1 Tax=Cuscuta epithymum TaxID=186058 RepID=A0AAV0D724_9ASTE|nr:unnamed protein product [Cuscuta epithymum]
MRRMLNPKRVTWASDVNLCQVRLFLSEESPLQVGLSSQDHLQAKPSLEGGITNDDNLPPGFEAVLGSTLCKTKLDQIPLIKWERPPSFILDASWQVVAGEESQEREAQQQREMRVLEAIYPRPSSIPLNPSVVPTERMVVHNVHHQHTPLIPITPMEEDDTADTSVSQHDVSAAGPNMTNLTSPLIMEESGSATALSHTTTTGSSASSSGGGLEPDALAVAQAALSCIMANDHGNLIDRELLIKILSDPQIIGELVSLHGGDGGGSDLSRNNSSLQLHMIRPSNMRPPEISFSNPKPSPSSFPLTTTGVPFKPPSPSRVGAIPNSASATSSSTAPAKDLNYYKSLIQQHGGERQDTPPPLLPPTPICSGRGNQLRDSSPAQEPLVPSIISSRSSSRDFNKSKIMKPCIYYNSARGCRHGIKCAFLHNACAPQPSSRPRIGSYPDVQSTKRMKMEREITGT